jgi:hypothetical protein
MSTSVHLPSPSERSLQADAARDLTPLPEPCHQRLLSWDSPHTPLCRTTLGASTPSAEADSGRRCHPPTSCSARVVLHHLDGFLRSWAAGLLHPADGCEVRRVSRQAPRAVARVVLAFPASRFTPFEEFPSPVAASHHCDPCTSCRYQLHRGGGTSHDTRCRVPQPAPPQWNSRLQGISPLTSPLRPTTVSSSQPPVPSMGFAPLQGPLDSAPARPSREAAHQTNPGCGCLGTPALQRVAAPACPRASLQ